MKEFVIALSCVAFLVGSAVFASQPFVEDEVIVRFEPAKSFAAVI